MGMEQSHDSKNTGNATPMDKGVKGKNEVYGEWMMVSRRKSFNKTKAKLLGSKMSNSTKSSQHRVPTRILECWAMTRKRAREKLVTYCLEKRLGRLIRPLGQVEENQGQQRVLETLKLAGKLSRKLTTWFNPKE